MITCRSENSTDAGLVDLKTSTNLISMNLSVYQG